MAIQDDQLKQLAARYRAGLCSAEEIEQIRQWYDEFETNGYALPPDEEIDRASFEAALTVIRQVNEQQRNTTAEHNDNADPIVISIRKKRLRFIRYAAAAVLLIITGIGAYRYLKPSAKNNTLVQAARKDIAPGSNKAVLTLSNGNRIVLNNAQNGNLAQQGSTAVHKKDSGLVAYQVTAGNPQPADTPVDFNTISTPRGGQYQVILPDGTKAWLNAASSIRFPVMFKGTTRNVETTGEVYFEVAKDKRKPFIVATAGQTVTVLGTHFNIMAYQDENSVVTTLLEGSVNVARGDQSKTLKPGEQAIVDQGIKITTADTEDAIAWKNGLTAFTDADLKTIMRKASRWYDIDIEYRGQINERTFTGAISRKSNLSALLKILALNRIQSSVNGNKLIVWQ